MAIPPHDLYRRLHTGNDGDVEFYQRAVSGAHSVLELGCGWGRITRHLEATGRRLVGLDADPALLAGARAEVPGAEFFLGDMRRLDVAGLDAKGRFDRIIVPYSALFCLGGGAGVLECFKAAKSKLEPAGELWFDCYFADEFHALAARHELPADDDEPVLSFELDGVTYRVLEETTIDASQQYMRASYHVCRDTGPPVLTACLEHHYLLSAQILDLLRAADLEPALLAGGFAGQPADEEAEQLVVGATHPQGT